MCSLIAEVLMFISGCYTAIAGKFFLNSGRMITGWPARIAGMVLMVPLPAALASGLFLGVLVQFGIVVESTALKMAVCAEPTLIVGSLIAVAIFVRRVK